MWRSAVGRQLLVQVVIFPKPLKSLMSERADNPAKKGSYSRNWVFSGTKPRNHP
jgi:hypothetical protein